jgi:hypothetical protein
MIGIRSFILDLGHLIAACLAYGIVTIFNGYIQARLAKKFGDTTAEDEGFLTLNPSVYIDPIGFFCFVIFGFGWGKPVPLNPSLFRGRFKRLEILFTYASQPFSNALLIVLTLLLLIMTVGGLNGTLPVPTFLVAYPSTLISLRAVLLAVIRFALSFMLYSVLVALMRLFFFFEFDQERMAWSYIELFSMIVALFVIFKLSEPLFILLYYATVQLEHVMWYGWHMVATALRLIHWYQWR